MKQKIHSVICKKVFIFCVLLVPIWGHAFDENCRIFSLLPSLDTPLCIEPAIPRNFVAMSKNGKLDLNDWVYWGPKDVIEEYFINPSSLQQSILRIRLSQTVKQIASDRFSAENDEMCKLMAPLGLKRLFDVRMNWGKYPIYAVTCEFDKKWLYAAWVGLSDPQGSTLLFELVYPGTKPKDAQFALWDQFLDKTTTLAESTYLNGFRTTYAKGRTDVVLYANRFSIVGEQRYLDKRIRIVVDLKESGLEGDLDSVYFAHITPDCNNSGPGAKVYLELRRNDKAFTHMIPVVIKPVDEFSLEASDENITHEQEFHCMLREYLK